MKNKTKIGICILLIFLILSIFNKSYCFDIESSEEAGEVLNELEDIEENGDASLEKQFTGYDANTLWQKAVDFITRGSQIESINISAAAKPFIQIGQVLMSIAIIVLLIVTLVMGIKYMLVSPDERAILKKQLLGLIISAIVIFAAQAIWSISIRLMQDVTQSSKKEEQQIVVLR